MVINMKKGIILVAIVVVIGAVLYVFVIGGKSDKEKAEIRVTYSPGDFFTTNVKDSNPNKLLKAGVVLVVDATGLEETLKAKNAYIRDTIIFILRDLTEEDIKAEGRQDSLRDHIKDALNERLGITNVTEILFNDFVMA